MNRFFLRKGIFAIIAMSALSIAFFGCFHDSDDDDDDASSSSESASDKSVGILNGAYLDGLSEIKVSAALKSGVYSAGDSVSDLFSISTNSAKSERSVSSNYVSNFDATISKIFSDYFIVALSGKVALSDSSLKISVALPADKTSSGSALSVSPLTVNTGSAAAVSTASLALSTGTIPSASELAGKTFKYVRINCETGYKFVFYEFSDDGTTATQTSITYDTEDTSENETKIYTNVPYDSTTGKLPICHNGSGTVSYSSVSDEDVMTLKKVGDAYYLYSINKDFEAENSSTLFTTYYSLEDGEKTGDYIILKSDGTIGGAYEDSKNGNGTYSGSFINNAGVISLSYTMSGDGFTGSEEVIYTGSNIVDGGVFAEYLGEVPSN
jgi:hypothetical protein